MTPANVTTINGPGNTPVEHTLDWFQGHINAGRVKRETGRLILSGTRQIIGILEPDEPRDVASVLASVDDLAARWLRKNENSDASTATTYAQRAKRLLEWHKTFLENPMAFRFDVAERSSDGEKEKRKPKPKAQTAPVAPAPVAAHFPPADPTPATGLQKLRIRIGDGRYVTVEFPDDLTVVETARVFCALVPHASDFDPTNDRHRRLMLPQEIS